MMPVMGHATLESISLLSSVVNAFVDLCADDIEANEDACEAAVEQSLSMVTSLNPYVGYEKACKLAKEALASGATIRELCEQEQILSEEDLNHALDPMRMTEPQE
jgi:fumarate hydratase class II